MLINEDEQIEEGTNETAHSDTTAGTNGQTQNETIAEHNTVQNIDSMEEQMRNLLGDDISILSPNESHPEPAVDDMEPQNVPQQPTESSDVEVETENTPVEHELRR